MKENLNKWKDTLSSGQDGESWCYDANAAKSNLQIKANPVKIPVKILQKLDTESLYSQQFHS